MLVAVQLEREGARYCA